MKTSIVRLIAAAVALLASASATPAKELAELRLLYVGSERAAEFLPFLQRNVARVETKTRERFRPEEAASFDVVLLDWPQTGRPGDFPPKSSPLGKREEWTRPTVLLGSAGLNLAVVWKLKGGTGCTCMDPLAYDLRPHEIFNHPFKIDRQKMVKIPTPADFQAEIKRQEIEVLPLVEDYRNPWRAGWCSSAYDFARNPDVEFFCGGVNHKTPTAAGLWRQGNLLHFGFEQSPFEMNQSGRHLLLNAIAYISRFSEDRPIAVTPSVFDGKVARSRSSFSKALRNPEYQLDSLKADIAPELLAKLASLGRGKMAEWVDRDGQFVHPNANLQLELDHDLVALGTPFDKPDFFAKTAQGLRAGGPEAERARRLLERYVPAGPKAADADQWANWWLVNKAYAFPSDSSDYCWYIDLLAKKRGVPTGELRGPRRADVAAHGFAAQGEMIWVWTNAGAKPVTYHFRVTRQDERWEIESYLSATPGPRLIVGSDGADTYSTEVPSPGIPAAPAVSGAAVQALINENHGQLNAEIVAKLVQSAPPAGTGAPTNGPGSVAEPIPRGLVYYQATVRPGPVPENHPFLGNLVWLVFCQTNPGPGVAVVERRLPASAFSDVEHGTNNCCKVFEAWDGLRGSMLSKLFLIGANHFANSSGTDLFRAPYDKLPYTNFSVTVVSSTNVGELTVPLEFRMDWYGPDFDSPGFPLRSPYHIDGRVTSVAAVDEKVSGIPRMETGLHVTDYRARALYGVSSVWYLTDPRKGWLQPSSRPYKNLARGLPEGD